MFKILILDDEISICRQITSILEENEDYKLESLIKPEYLFEALKHHQADMLLLDVNLSSKNGIDVLAELKAHPEFKQIPVIMITGDVNEELLAQCFQNGAADFIHKPFSILELKARVSSCLKIYEYETQLEDMVKEKTQELLHTSKLATIGELSSMIAHELRQPLSVLEMESSNMKESLEEKDYGDILISTNMIQKATKRAIQITGRMSDFSQKNNETQKSDCSPQDIIDNTMILLDKKLKMSNITIINEVQADLPNLKCDSLQIEQVMTNLINNANDAFTNEAVKKITIGAALENEKIYFMVEDTAGGIPVKNLSNIFNSFYTTKDNSKGLGLGLSICKTIASEHGGKLEAANTEMGAKFTLSLPL